MKDFDKLELRFLVTQAIRQPGSDPHTLRASEMFGVPPEAVTADQRMFAKQESFVDRYTSRTGRLSTSVPQVQRIPLTPFKVNQESFQRQAAAANEWAHEWYALTLTEMDAWRMYGIECELIGDELLLAMKP